MITARYISTLTLCFLVAGASLPAQEFHSGEGAKLVMTLSQSLARSLSNNPKILQARQEMNIARTNVSQAKSLFFPHVDLNLHYIRYRNQTRGITSPDLGFALLEPTPRSGGGDNRFESDNLYLGRFGFKQTLYAGGRLNSTYDLSKANLETSNVRFESIKREVDYQVKESFYSLLCSKRKQELVEETLENLRAFRAQSVGPREQMMLVRTQAEVREKTAHIKKEEQQQRANYLQAIGMELFSDVEVSGEIEPARLSLDLQQILAWAKQNRIELRETQLAEEVDRLSVSLAMSERYPVLLLGGAYEMRDRDLDFGQNNWNAGLSMNIPIFDGFSGIARIKESRYKAKQGQYRRVQLEDQIEKEVRSAFDDMVFWQMELKNREEELATLKRIADKGRGLSSMSDRIEFVKWRLESGLKVADAKLNLILALSKLEFAVGRSLAQ